jgi:hypothetical protein
MKIENFVLMIFGFYADKELKFFYFQSDKNLEEDK